MDFVADQVAKTLLVELHPDLRVTSVKSADGQRSELRARTTIRRCCSAWNCPARRHRESKLRSLSSTAGRFRATDDSPTQGVRFASVDKTSAYLLLPARWFPLTNYPSNRYTGTFKIIVPDTFAVAGTGKADAPTMMPAIGKGDAEAKSSYVFHCDQPGPVGSFVAGNLQLSPVKRAGLSVLVYTPARASLHGGGLREFAGADHELFLRDFRRRSQRQPSMTVAQMPDGSLDGYSAPGLLLISARQWTPRAERPFALAARRRTMVGQSSAACLRRPMCGSPTGFRATPRPCTPSNPTE